MARLRQDFTLRILYHQSPGILLNLNRAVVTLIGDGVCRLTAFPGSPLLTRLKLIAEHHIVLILCLWHDRCCQHADSRRLGRYEFYRDLQIRIILIRRIREVEHLHAHRPVAVEIKRLTRTHPVTFPLHEALTLRRIETHQRVGEEIGIRQIHEIRRHIFLHTLQVLHTRIRLYLRRRTAQCQTKAQ